MAKPHHVIAVGDLNDFVTTRDDFAFEREVFNLVINLGLEAEHAGLYEDPITLKPRQFDIRARKSVTAKGYRCTINLTIECKGLAPTFPLLVSCVPRARDETGHDLLTTVGNNLSAVNQRGFYRSHEYVGKSMRQIGKSRDGELFSGDEVFDKWMQALASAGEVIYKEADRIVAGNGPAELVAFLPVLVVSDNTLWVAKYRADGTLDGEPSLAEEITFYLGRKYKLERQNLTFTISHLHVHTRSRFPSLITEIAGGGALWPQLIPV